MQTARRQFIARAAASAWAVVTLGRTGRADRPQEGPGPAQAPAVPCLDYGLSFLCNPSPKNAVRFWIESRTMVVDEAAGRSNVLYQCASCKSEHTFAEKGLFHEDNYDFLPIFAGDECEHLLVFRRPARLSDRYRQISNSEDVWGKPILKLREGKPVEALDTWEAIRDATAAGIPLVSRTQIADPQTGLRAIIECPVKTMNISLERRMYQVDTGPIAFADLSRGFDALLENVHLAFVAFNAPHFADFVIEQPTPVIEDGNEIGKIYHYSNPISLPAANALFAVGAPAC